MTNLNYTTPSVDQKWCDTRATAEIVAAAIHAIASHDRTPDAIWDSPTAAEWDHVVIAVGQYHDRGFYDAETEVDKWSYCWGCELVEGTSA